MLDGLPNCVFDSSGPLRQYTPGTRAAGFITKMAELSGVGLLTGVTTSLLSAAAVTVRQKSNPDWQPSVDVPAPQRSSGGLAAFFGLNANARYQVVGGLDRVLFGRTNFLWTYLCLSGAVRLVSSQVGELSRPWWQGLPSPSTLPPVIPTHRRVRKKVSKRVPKSRRAAAAAAAATAAAKVGEAPAVDIVAAATPLEVAVEAAGGLSESTESRVLSGEGQGVAVAAVAPLSESGSMQGGVQGAAVEAAPSTFSEFSAVQGGVQVSGMSYMASDVGEGQSGMGREVSAVSNRQGAVSEDLSSSSQSSEHLAAQQPEYVARQ